MQAAGLRDRAAGAIVGAFIGDALGMGVHWYYDLEEMKAAHGPFVRDYTDPVKGRYHDELKAGDLTQSGYILTLMLKTVVQEGGYRPEAFQRTLDTELFPKLDGTPRGGPGGYTSQSIRHAYEARVQAGLPWGQAASKADTTEAIERNLALGVLYALDPTKLAETVSADTLLTQDDDMIVCFAVAFNAVLAQLVRGQPFTEAITDHLMAQVDSGELPFHCVTTGAKHAAPEKGAPEPPRAGRFVSPDALLTPGSCAASAKLSTQPDSGLQIEPASRVCLLYGLPCAAYHVLPACYYLAARFSNSFEDAVLHALNGGGQNAARTMLTGALVGAQVGLSGIPPRFIDGLTEKTTILALAEKLADLVVQKQS